MAAEITAHESIRPGLGALTATALGLPDKPIAATTPALKGTAMPTTTPAAASRSHDDLDSLPLTGDDELDALPVDHEPDLDADPDMELPDDDPDMELPGGRPTRKQALAMVLNAIGELAARGQSSITVRDLPDPAQLDRSRQWLSGVLAEFARDGLLVEAGTDGNATRYALPMRNAA
jgi:hypothetical protein